MGAVREIKIIGCNYKLSTFVEEVDYQTLRLWEYRLSRLIGRNTTYIKTSKNSRKILLHRLIMGLENGPTSVLVDHIDGNGLNNLRDNLRITDNSGNMRNARKRLSETSSLYKGVHKHSNNKSKPWHVSITLSGKRQFLGYYRTEIEAATAYNKAAIELFGPMAFLNVLPDQK